MTSLEYDNETPLDDDEYEYAGDDDEDDMNQIQSKMYNQDDDDESDDDDDEQIIRQSNNNNNNSSGDQNKSQASYNDEMNLIDYVIEEEKEIGGNKGEDSLSTSRSTTYSRYFNYKEKRTYCFISFV